MCAGRGRLARQAREWRMGVGLSRVAAIGNRRLKKEEIAERLKIKNQKSKSLCDLNIFAGVISNHDFSKKGVRNALLAVVLSFCLDDEKP